MEKRERRGGDTEEGKERGTRMNKNNYSMRVKILIGREEMNWASLSCLLVFADIGKEVRIIL